jgi:hypothetical protein
VEIETGVTSGKLQQTLFAKIPPVICVAFEFTKFNTFAIRGQENVCLSEE